MDIDSYIQEMRELMKERHITQKELSEMSGVPTSTVRKVMARITASPSKNTLDRLSSVLGIEPFVYNEKETRLYQIKEWFEGFDIETIREFCNFTETHDNSEFDWFAALKKIQ